MSFIPVRAYKLLAHKRAADMAVTTDQPLIMANSLTKYTVEKIIVTNASTDMTLLGALGGFYTAASKGGTSIVASSQAYAALTAASKYLSLTLQSIIGTDVLTSSQLYLSLSTAASSACTADIYVFGLDLT